MCNSQAKFSAYTMCMDQYHSYTSAVLEVLAYIFAGGKTWIIARLRTLPFQLQGAQINVLDKQKLLIGPLGQS